MAATSSIKIVKSFAYEGGTKLWSNRYHFNTGEPPDSTHWSALATAIVTAEKAIYPSYVQIVEAVAYTAGSDLPLFSYSFSTNGTFAPGGTAVKSPGDCCKINVWTTAARTSKNHPVYLFSYWHGVMQDSSGSPDEIHATQRSAYHTYAQSWITGFSDGSTTFHRAGPNGASAVDFKAPVPDYIRHRDFPR